MKIELDIYEQDLEQLGVDFVKQSYIGLLSTMVGYSSLRIEVDLSELQEDLEHDQHRVKAFETVLNYILPRGEANAFITQQHQAFSKQLDLFN
tara:strand:- start:225 stop:503 length:279 start_codon:yes stop_codon:yes gene_type:complete